MDASETDILVRHPVPRHRLTVTEYRRLGQAGILGQDERVELLDGQLVDMSPIGPRHAIAVDRLLHSLAASVGDKAYVRGQNPVTLDDGSEPQPDVAVVRMPWNGYPDAHPGPEDIFLLVEVADSSIGTDAGAKLAIYARAGIREVWIVDLSARLIHVHRRPGGLTYGHVATINPPAALGLEAMPGVSIISTLFV